MKRQNTDAQLEDDIAMALATERFVIVDRGGGLPSADTVARLERAYQKAHQAEMRYVGGLAEKPSKRALAHAWKLAERANVARRALGAARDAMESK